MDLVAAPLLLQVMSKAVPESTIAIATMSTWVSCPLQSVVQYHPIVTTPYSQARMTVQ